MKTFSELGLSNEIQKGLVGLGYIEATPIQEQAIPFVLNNDQDLIGLAQTGTGKTAAFGLPILNKLQKNKEAQAIILCPTRELCLQISRELSGFAKYLPHVLVATVYGGARIDTQIRELRSGANLIVGTPGRVHDMIRRKFLSLKTIRFVVLDEADEMLDLGFKDDLDEILSETPKNKQTLLFSATMSPVVRNIATKYMNKPQEISIGKKNVGADQVSHEYYLVRPSDKYEALRRIIDFEPNIYGILFCRTRHETQEIADKLREDRYSTEALHGDVSQNLRTQIMERFRERKIQLLVATDVAARGIDVSDLTHVINYNLPDSSEVYLHRSGRTGRAHKSGTSISLFTPRELRKVSALENRVGKPFVLKTVPKGQDICKNQLLSLIEKMKNIAVDRREVAQFMPIAEEALKGLTKEEIIAKFISTEFNHFLNLYRDSSDLEVVDVNKAIRERRDRSERQADENFINVKINVGRLDKFDIKVLFGLINSQRELKGVEIGRIKIDDSFTVFGVDKNKKDDVKRVFKKLNFKGKNFKVEVDSVVKDSKPRRRVRGDGRRRLRSRG